MPAMLISEIFDHTSEVGLDVVAMPVEVGLAIESGVGQTVKFGRAANSCDNLIGAAMV